MINKLNKLGYTKVELLIVVVLLGIVAFITINSTSYAFEVDDKKAVNELVKLIELEAEEYGMDHLELFEDTTVTTITVEDLVNENLIGTDDEGQVLNPANSKESYNDKRIKLEYNSKNNKITATLLKSS